MFKTIIRVSSERPDLMQAYLSSYADLLHDSWHQSKRYTIRRVFCAVLACMSTIAFMVVSAMAFMLSLNLPESDWQQLIIPPVVLLLVTVAFVLLTVYQRNPSKLLKTLSHELQQDRRLLETAQGL